MKNKNNKNNKNKEKEKKEEFNAWTPFTLYYKGNSVKFNNLQQFTDHTSISGAVALDMVLGKDLSEYKGWSKKGGNKYDNDFY